MPSRKKRKGKTPSKKAKNDPKAGRLTWHTEQRRVGDLVPYEKNPRRMTDKQRSDLKASIEEFDLVEVPAIDVDNVVVAGNQRLAELLSRGEKDRVIDVRVPSRKLTKDEFRKYNLRSNKNTGDFDGDMVGDIPADVLKAVGFEDYEIRMYQDDYTIPDVDLEGRAKKKESEYLIFVFTPEEYEYMVEQLDLKVGVRTVEGKALLHLISNLEEQMAGG